MIHLTAISNKKEKAIHNRGWPTGTRTSLVILLAQLGKAVDFTLYLWKVYLWLFQQEVTVVGSPINVC